MSQSIRQNDVGKFEQNLTARKINNIENLLNSVDFTTSSMRCGEKLGQQRIRFTNGRYESTPLETIDLTSISGGVDATGIDQYKVLQADGSNSTTWLFVTKDNITAVDETAGKVLEADGSDGVAWADKHRQLPSNANASQYRVLQISSDVGASDDPTKWEISTVKWI